MPQKKDNDLGIIPDEDLGLVPDNDLGLIPEDQPTKKDSGAVQAVAKLLTMPGRGFRGLGVLAQRVLEDDGFAEALDRAAEATKPDFQAKEGEKIGATAGQIIGDAPLFAAIAAALGPAAGALKLGPTAAAALQAGGGAATATGLEELSSKGELDPLTIAGSALLGAGLGAGASKVGQKLLGKAPLRAKTITTEPPLVEPPPITTKPVIEPPPSGPIPPEIKSHIESRMRAGNINLTKMKTTDDVKQLINDINTEFEDIMLDQRRGVVHWDKTEANAALLGITPSKMAKIPMGRAANAENLLAQQEILIKGAQEVQALRQVATEINSNENLIKYSLALRRQATLQKVYSGEVAEAGRSLNILRRMADPAKQEVHNLEALLESLGGRDFNEDLVRKLSQIDPKDTFAVNRFVREATEATTIDKLYEVWMNGILSSPMTHKVNTISNSLFAASRIPERILRGIVDVGFSAFTKKRTQYVAEATQDFFGMMRGLDDGVRRGLHSLRYGMTESQATKLDVKTVEAMKGTLGSVVRLPGKFLTAEDEFFKAVTGVGERTALAYRFAKQQGLKGEELVKRIAELEANPTTEMKVLVNEEELYRTFQSNLGKVGQKMMNLRNEMPLLRWVVPFLRTPVNLAKRSLERTPANAFNIAYKTLLREGPYSQVEAVKDTANLAIGSMLAGTAAFYAVTDRITGTSPKSPGEKDAFFRAGKQPYSIKIGDSWYSYDRLEPWSMSIGLVADAIQEARDKGPGGILNPEAVSAALLIIPKNLSSKTFLSGISDAFDAISDPERYGEKWVSRFASGAIPFSAALRFTAQLKDSVIRKPETLSQAVMANIPVLSELVPARRNVFGEPVTRPNDIFSLAIVKKTEEVHSKIEDEMQRLDIAISFPSNKINGNKLSQGQYERYLITSGQAIKNGLSSLVKKPGWSSVSDEGKRKHMSDIVRDSRENTRKILIREYPNLRKKKK